MSSATKEGSELLLPISVTGRVQLSRLVRELEEIENDIEAQKARDRKVAQKIPAMSQGLADCVELNKVDILKGAARMDLKRRLVRTKEKAPTIHFTFAVEADPRSLQQLVTYIRKEIHPQALISVGMQPGLVGGAFVRTPNHIHDFSLRALLKGKRNVITDALAEGIASAQLAAIEAANAAVVVQAPDEQKPASEAGAARSTAVASTTAAAQRATTPPPTRQVSPDGWPERRVTEQPATRQPVQTASATRGSHAN